MKARAGLLLLSIPLVVGAADRDTAEWVIRQGGQVVLNGNRAAVRKLWELPSGELTVTGVDLTGTLIEPKDLERIGQLAHLHELYLPGPSWNPGSGSRLDANDQLKFIAGLKELERLDFSLHFLPTVNVLDKGLALLIGLTQLKEMR